METLRETLEAWWPDARARLEGLDFQPRLQRFGRIERIGDGVATVSGLEEARLDELLVFPEGVLGFAVELGFDEIGCVLLGSAPTLAAGGRVEGTGAVVRVPVGTALLGRVVDPTGRPLDDGPPISAERLDPVQRPAPPIIERELVTQPLATGITVIDAMFPLGRGQRELIVGDRSTGKTAIAVDTLINQRRSDVICVYVAVGQKLSAVRSVIDAVRAHGAFERCLFVVAGAEAPPGLQWLAPYAGFSMAEYFRDRGQHALVVLDDLTKHAATHRQLALLLRQPVGREAYPGDIFHIHARLLERAARLSERQGGGSLTALPIAELQGGNLSGYIPTNLISITDGQIVLDSKLFQEGQKPAVDVGLSVSRVGGKTQAPAMHALAERLRLEYAQFLELEVFTRFGAMTDERTRKVIDHGRRIRAILGQPQYAPLSLGVQVAQLLALSGGLLDRVALDRLSTFTARMGPWLSERAPAALARVEQTGALDAAAQEELLRALEALVQALGAQEARTHG